MGPQGNGFAYRAGRMRCLGARSLPAFPMHYRDNPTPGEAVHISRGKPSGPARLRHAGGLLGRPKAVCRWVCGQAGDSQPMIRPTWAAVGMVGKVPKSRLSSNWHYDKRFQVLVKCRHSPRFVVWATLVFLLRIGCIRGDALPRRRQDLLRLAGCGLFSQYVCSVQPGRS